MLFKVKGAVAVGALEEVLEVADMDCDDAFVLVGVGVDEELASLAS